MGEDKYKFGCDRLFPMGPKCKFQGKEVPCFVSCTENGSITSALLGKMLEAIDLAGVFPRGPGFPNQLLLCDGHVSRFDFPFLKVYQ
jgi:hypothetical protein